VSGMLHIQKSLYICIYIAFHKTLIIFGLYCILKYSHIWSMYCIILSTSTNAAGGG